MLFRHDRPRLTAINPNIEDELLLRYRTQVAAARAKTNGRSSTDNTLVATEMPPEARPTTVVTPLDRREPPPSLPSDGPSAQRPVTASWGQSMEMMLPVVKPADDTTRTHTVVDGDQLEALAERYLGSTARADEIYQLNRNVIDNPRLLPIGIELKLPPRNR
jgi:nucleoid-associated protein YgaU